jgi:CheY-like chemotaxis protein
VPEEIIAHRQYLHQSKRHAPIRLVSFEEDGLRILICEDDQAQLQWLHTNLTSLGHTVCPASDGDEALNIYEKNRPFDMVITDYLFPGKVASNGTR